MGESVSSDVHNSWKMSSQIHRDGARRVEKLISKRVEAQKQRLTRGSKDGEATYYSNAQKDVEMDNTIEYRNLLTTHNRAEQYSPFEFESYAF